MKITKAIRDAVKKIKVHSAIRKEETDMPAYHGFPPNSPKTSPIYTTSSAVSTMWSVGPEYNIGPHDEKELEHEAFKTPIEDLVNMWTAKFGSEFVTSVDVCEEDFYRLAASRLLQAGKLETYNFSGMAKYKLLT